MFVLYDFIKFLFLSGRIVSTLLTLSLRYMKVGLLKDVRIFWNIFGVLIFQQPVGFQEFFEVDLV